MMVYLTLKELQLPKTSSSSRSGFPEESVLRVPGMRVQTATLAMMLVLKPGASLSRMLRSGGRRWCRRAPQARVVSVGLGLFDLNGSPGRVWPESSALDFDEGDHLRVEGRDVICGNAGIWLPCNSAAMPRR